MDPDKWDIDVERDEEFTVEFSVSIPDDEVKPEREQAINELKQEVDIPGFRKGKVPNSIIEKRHGAQIQQKLLERLVPKICQTVYQEHEIQPIDQPQIQDFDINGEFYLSASVQEQPQVSVDPDDYMGIELDDPGVETADDKVDEELENLLSSQASLDPIPIARPVQDGDFVNIDFQGFDESGNPLEGAGAEDKVVEIGAGRFIDEIEDVIIGMEEGDATRVKVDFPDDFIDDSLAGMTVDFDVSINEIQEQRNPEPDDPEFLEKMGVESEQELREKIKEQIEQSGEEQRRNELAEQVYDHLLDEYDFSIPESLQESEIDKIIEDYEQQVSAQNRDFDEFLSEQDMTRDELREEAKPEAKRRIRLTLLLHSIAEEEDIEVSDDEFQDHLEDLADNAQMGRDQLSEIPDEQLQSIRYQLRDDKLLDHLIENAEIKSQSEGDTDSDGESSD